jgi:hypothetical protein
MRRFFAFLWVTLGLIWAGAAWAQSVFVQIEAYPTLAGAEEAARDYAQDLEDVNGFRFTTGWYVVTLGPYDLNTAVERLNTLRTQRRIPSDSYLVDRNAYSSPFFPVGNTGLTTAPEEAAATTPETQTETTAAAPAPQPEPAPEVIPEETRNQALRSEGQLSRQQKFDLQIALQWFGFYTGRIDAAFGRGTRASMAAWQVSKGYDDTGVLTTRQRAELLSDYETVLASIGLQTITDAQAGITLQIPAAMVGFDRHDPPFAHYTPLGNSGVTVLLISRSGDENSLIGLYDIMQTLKIVPLEGERQRRANSFTLTGQNERIKSHTYAVLNGGEIKGFTLIWPTGKDDRLYDVVLTAMRESFTPISGTVLPDTLGEGALEQSLDLISGLEIRRPISSVSGFYVNSRGAVLTDAAAVAGCARVTLDEVYEARVAASDAGLGLALLQPEETLAPLDFARFQPGTPRLQSEIAVAGYSFGGMLGAPTLTFGTLADVRGLQGEETLKRLALRASPGDAGGPVFDASGAVLGMLRPSGGNSSQVLPPDVSFATDAQAISGWLSANGAPAAASDRLTAMSAEDLTRQAANLTVLVGCWDE